MKIIQVVPSIEYMGGPSFSVPALCRGLANIGHDVRLHVLGPTSPRDEPFPIISHHWMDVLKPLGISPAMSRALREESKRVDIIHNSGLWTMPNVYVGWAAKRGKAKLVFAPRGGLAAGALRHSRLKKRLFWPSFQAQALRRTSCFHVTSHAEGEDVRRAGFRQPAMLLPNPMDMPKEWQKDRQEEPRLLYLGRLHPIKGIDFLLEAWAAVQDEFPHWHLDLAGPDNDGYQKHLEGMVERLKLRRVSFLGSLFGEEKDAAFAKADLYVLPTHTENFGITVAEALVREVPAITTHGAPWKELVERDCGWWIPIGTEPLIDCLRGALAKPRPELHAMGERGRGWMLDTLSCETVAESAIAAYEWLLYGGTPPAHILLD